MSLDYERFKKNKIIQTMMLIFQFNMSAVRKEMEKYRDIDEDELLKKLSEEELQRLEDELEELDPDVSWEHKVNEILPASVWSTFVKICF